MFYAPAPAVAVSTDSSAAKGRATGSGKWGYVGQFGKLNKTTQPALGDFFLPYGIDIDGQRIAVTDSGRASWESGSKTIGHSLQTFTQSADPGSAGHGDYLGGGQYDVVDSKSGVIDPHSVLTPNAIDVYPVGAPRGPRGVVYGAGDSVYSSSYEVGTGTTTQMRQYASDALGTVAATWGSSDYRVAGALPGAVAVDTDAQGNVYTGTNFGVSVNSADGTFQSSVGVYFDQNGQNQSSRVQWATRATDVPREYGKPDLIGETYGLSVSEENGQTVIYVGDAGAYYQPDYTVHFQNGATTAQNTKPASIKKYILTPSGGTTDARWNPAGWKWTLDTSFGNGGAVQFAQNSLTSFFGRPIWSGQTVFALEADPESGALYYALNGVAGKKLGAVDLATGAEIEPTPAPVNGPSAQQDSAMNYVRGIAVDDRGLVYATTQNATTASTTRAIVQIWGKTPTSIADTAQAAPRVTSATLTWGESTVGYQQPDLLDYVVKYRKVGDADWTVAPVPGGAATSTELTRELTGLTADTDYEAIITPFNEAGSGDPALISWRTEAPDPSLAVAKTGNGVATATQDEAVNVAAASDVTFEYTITNDGNVPVTEVGLTDSILGDVALPADFDGSLDPDESVTVQAVGPIGQGDYTNRATGTGVGDGEDLTATDDWYGFGVTQGLEVEKRGDGKTAESADEAIHVTAGKDVTFTYTVTNTGNSPVEDLALTDSVLGTVTGTINPADFDGTLAPGASVTFEATGPVAEGPYMNTADATGTVAAIDVEVSTSADWYGHGDKKEVPVDPEDPTDPEAPVITDPHGPQEDDLSRTGASSLLPLALSAGVLLAGGALLLLRRKTREG